MKMNIGPIDRLVRVIIVIILCIVAYQLSSGWLYIIAALILLTAIIGICPLYWAFKCDTNKPKAARVQHDHTHTEHTTPAEPKKEVPETQIEVEIPVKVMEPSPVATVKPVVKKTAPAKKTKKAPAKKTAKKPAKKGAKK